MQTDDHLNHHSSAIELQRISRVIKDRKLLSNATNVPKSNDGNANILSGNQEILIMLSMARQNIARGNK